MSDIRRNDDLTVLEPSEMAPRATLLPAATPESQGFSAVRLARLDAALAAAVDRQEVGGMAYLLARNGKVVDCKTLGDAAPGQPMQRDTIFRIFSMTKVITAVAMMMLFEEGKWALDDPIAKHIPAFTDLKVAADIDLNGEIILEPLHSPPTMRQLMAHMAGFGYGFGPGPVDKLYAAADPLGAPDLATMIDRLANLPLHYQPGTAWQYSIAVDIQGYLIEQWSGLRLGEFLRTRIFAPLKMVDTGFHIPADQYHRFASLYYHDETGALVAGSKFSGGLFGSDYRTPPALESGGAGLVSTLDDCARFAAMLANGGELDGERLLVPATIAVMQANVVPDEVIARGNPYPQFGKGLGWGMGVMTVNDPPLAGRIEGKGTISWEGAAGTWFWADPANRVAFVGMVQNFERAGPPGYDGSYLVRPLVYQALVAP
ncbi:serine hydrolase domain-containing protein [Sphingobium nicotianae]|uniref:Beta-lactamase family protein n=1 Tax=Sphingobium nicotianae TaxID=2782607 RepID=A0A9X1DDV9_9SPHN|nr:serine hydrolase domain-containing protein [Sphingobium nicotianae]MBT2187743.1 beta-lactamase family protein [Sphingobium nicotianae]